MTMLMGICLILLFFEEINWGQRILGFDTPEVVSAVNHQEEFNLHNMAIMGTSNNFFTTLIAKGLLVYLGFLPLLAQLYPTIKRWVDYFCIPLPSLHIALNLFILQFVAFLTFKVFYGTCYDRDLHHIGEIKESALELLLLVLAIEVLMASGYGKVKSSGKV